MTHIAKHHGKQEGECNYGVHRCRGIEGEDMTEVKEKQTCEAEHSLASSWRNAFSGVQPHLDWPPGSWPLRRHQRCFGNQLWKSWGETGSVEVWKKAGGCRKNRPRCHSSSDDGEEGEIKMKGLRSEAVCLVITSPRLQLYVSAIVRCLTPPSLRALCSSGSLAVGHQASAIRHLSVTDGLQRFSTIWTALHFCTRTFHWGSTATARISSCCKKASVCDNTWGKGKWQWGFNQHAENPHYWYCFYIASLYRHYNGEATSSWL